MSQMTTDESGATLSKVDFCTLGMFIIDEIHFKPPIPSVYNILGGAGSYSALGARIFSPDPKSKSVGWIVDAGSDFPQDVRDVIDSWGTSCLIRDTPERPTTRGWNGYGDGEVRAFRYMTPKLRLDHNSLNEQLLLSKSFHLISSPLRCIDLVNGIMGRRQPYIAESTVARPIIVYEPVPDLCIPEEFENCLKALKSVDFVSPNHVELCGFFGKEPHDENAQSARETIEQCCRVWLESGIGNQGKGAIVVRVGKDGCYIASRQKTRWIRAYHQNSSKVVDPTGGGNTFLGGFSIGLCNMGNTIEEFVTLEKAAVWGSVAASFAIEQVGMPTLAGLGLEETWNGERAMSRVDEMFMELGMPR